MRWWEQLHTMPLAPRTQSGLVNAFGYSGEQYTPATGLLHLRARDLNPRLGRFLQRGYRPAQRSRNARLQSLRLRRQQSRTSTRLRASLGRSQWLLAAAGELDAGAGRDPRRLDRLAARSGDAQRAGSGRYCFFSLLLTCFLNDECRPTWADANQLIKQLGSDAVNTVQWTAEPFNNAFAKYPLLPGEFAGIASLCGAGIGCHWSRHGDRLCSLYLGKRSVDRAGELTCGIDSTPGLP
ncbi:MAG: hypothetical protein R2867_17375 [Caldilineaceae bacterium]